MTHPDIAFATELNPADIEKAIRRARKLRAEKSRMMFGRVFAVVIGKPAMFGFAALKSLAALAVVPVARPIMRKYGAELAA